MPGSPTLPAHAQNEDARITRLLEVRNRYVYRKPAENLLHPIAMSKSWPTLREEYDPKFLFELGAGYVGAGARRYRKLAKYGIERLLFRFDKMKAYRDLLSGVEPGYLDFEGSDEAFGHWRVAGANALSIVQEKNLVELCKRIPLNERRIEERINEGLGERRTLAHRAASGELFVVDFALLKRCLRPESERDSRWRSKYLPAPIGVFLEAPGFHPSGALVPLAIQVDQIPDRNGNPVHHAGDGWAWEIAKSYFEVADLNHHVGQGHIHHTHLALEPFAMATPRQLSEDHPVYVLLRPHLRFTLRVNKAAYDYFENRNHTYADFYAGTLEETRRIAIESRLDTRFCDLELEADLAARNVGDRPASYPYREDSRRWVEPIRNFVSEYVLFYYHSDADVVDDRELSAWVSELTAPDEGGVRGLVREGILDTREKLIDVLSLVIYIAGPGHASQHYSSNHFYRYSPSFPGAAYVPPFWRADQAHEGRHENMFAPIKTAARQVMYNTFTNYRYDRFGDYRRYRLGSVPEAQGAIERLCVALSDIETGIEAANEHRLVPYEFLLPSKVPNSVHI